MAGLAEGIHGLVHMAHLHLRDLDPLERWTDEEWDAGGHMSMLAERFPCLVGKPGVRPWDPDRLERWALREGLSATELFAARFALQVWDGEREWRCGRFDFLNALDHWDEHHRAAFASWAMDPWWPLSLRTSRPRDSDSFPDTLRSGGLDPRSQK